MTNTKLTPKNNPSNGPTMTSSAQYDANGNRLLSVTDNAGATVEYGYSGELSKMLALPESVTDALGNITRNAYDSFGRIEHTSLANGSGVVYTYTKGQLSELSRRTGSTTQNYSFVYNSFGRMTELKVGSRTLAKLSMINKLTVQEIKSSVFQAYRTVDVDQLLHIMLEKLWEKQMLHLMMY